MLVNVSLDCSKLSPLNQSGEILCLLNAEAISDIRLKIFYSWAPENKNANILLVVAGEKLKDNEARSLGFSISTRGYGYFKYLREHMTEGMLEVDFNISPNVRELRIYPFLTDSPFFVIDMEIRAPISVHVEDAKPARLRMVAPGNPTDRAPKRTNESGAGNLPISFISFDVEALPGRAKSDHIDRLIWGRFDGKEYGISRISAILNQHRIKGNFMIDFGACMLYGDKPVKKIVDFLLSEGHEVHAHMHSETVLRRWEWGDRAKKPVYLNAMDEALTLAVLRFTAFKYRALTGQDPVVFRSGGYLFNPAVVSAAKAVGFLACSNFNSARHANAWKSHNARVNDNEPFLWRNGLIELPVDFSPEPLDKSWDAYRRHFTRAQQKNLQTFNLTLHSWSLTTRNEAGVHVAFNPYSEAYLHRICKHLTQNTRPMGYAAWLAGDFDLSETESPSYHLTQQSLGTSAMSCTICGASFGARLSSDICPGCTARARHRQILDVFNRTGNPFETRSVLACHANPIERQAFLAKASRVVNFDVRPLGYADLQMDIQSMDKIEDNGFDVFLAIHVLNHVTDDAKALQEVRRVLRPGGIAVITVSCRANVLTEDCADLTQHYGEEALRKFGVGTYRRYGLRDVQELFSRYFEVDTQMGTDSMTNSQGYVFFLTKV